MEWLTCAVMAPAIRMFIASASISAAASVARDRTLSKRFATGPLPSEMSTPTSRFPLRRQRFKTSAALYDTISGDGRHRKRRYQRPGRLRKRGRSPIFRQPTGRSCVWIAAGVRINHRKYWPKTRFPGASFKPTARPPSRSPYRRTGNQRKIWVELYRLTIRPVNDPIIRIRILPVRQCFFASHG